MDTTKYNEIVQNWIKQVQENCEADAELTLKYCKELIEYGQKTGDHGLVGFAHYYRSVVFYVLNDGNQFFEAVSDALAELTQADEWDLMCRCYNFLGITAMSRGNSAVALDYYLNAISYSEKTKEAVFSPTIQVNIGVLNIVSGRYADAIENLKSAYESYSTNTESPRYDDIMICIYENMAKAYLCQGELEKAKECFDRIYENHMDYMDNYAMVTVYCTEAMYYHIVGDQEKCEEKIARVHKETNANVPVLDLFDDYYDYCKVLLDRDKDMEFWHIIEIMEPMVKSVDITNLQQRLLNLKIKAYRKNKQSAEYLQAAGLFYELSERAEAENKVMMNNMLNLRRNLERVNREKKEVEAKNEILRAKSETDALTGLANRFRFNDYSEEAFQRAVDNKTPLAVEILDMDSFKGYNDTYGHQRGDECIQKVASAIQSMQEFGAFTARYGGDEFIVIYEDITKEQAIEYASTLRERVMALGIVHEKSTVANIMTISQGLCWDVPIEGNRMWDYLHAADDMLYRVKKSKRNNFCVGNLKESSEDIVMSYL